MTTLDDVNHNCAGKMYPSGHFGAKIDKKSKIRFNYINIEAMIKCEKNDEKSVVCLC